MQGVFVTDTVENVVRIARRAPPNVPSYGILYGPSGLGKSTKLVEGLCNALGACRKGGLLPASSFIGLRTDLGQKPIREVHVSSLFDVLVLIRVAREKGFDAVIVDDLTLVAEETVPLLEAQHGADGWGKWMAFKQLMLDIRMAGRASGIHVWFNAHPREPWLDKKTGRMEEGGPMLPSKNQTKTLPHEVDTGLYIIEDSTRPGDCRAARASFTCGALPGWWTKDRHSAAPPQGPANLRAVLVTAGYNLSRRPGLEWQDQIMWGAAEKIMALARESSEGPIQAGRAYGEQLYQRLLDSGRAPEHIMWALRDAFALAEIQLIQRERHLSGFFATAPSEQEAAALL